MIVIKNADYYMKMLVFVFEGTIVLIESRN